MFRVIWDWILGPVVRWIVLENAAEVLSIKIGFTAVVSVIVIAFADAIRDLPLAWQAFFIAGIFFIIHFAAWMVWPSPDWILERSRRQALVARD